VAAICASVLEASIKAGGYSRDMSFARALRASLVTENLRLEDINMRTAECQRGIYMILSAPSEYVINKSGSGPERSA
jgi:hypothetical protein